MRKRKRRSLKQEHFLLDRERISELSRIARRSHPDGHGDYLLPETKTGRHLAVAILTHLLQRPCARGVTTFQFCRERAPWLDPDEIGIDGLCPIKAQELGDRLQLTAAERTELHITTIAPCDQTPKQRAALRKERRRQYDRERQRRKREAKAGMSRAQYLAASKSRTRPWEAEGVSRRTWYRRRGTSTSHSKEPLLLSEQPVPTGNGTAVAQGRALRGRATGASVTAAWMAERGELDGQRATDRVMPMSRRMTVEQSSGRVKRVGVSRRRPSLLAMDRCKADRVMP
jgi:hypothetical protein